MKKGLVEKFADFKKRHHLSNSDIEKMMVEYANTEFDLSPETLFKIQLGDDEISYIIAENISYEIIK